MVKYAKKPQDRRGGALLVCLFCVFMVSASVLNIIRTETLQFASVRNSIEYEKALYLANAGVHHACVELIADSDWRGSVSDGIVPPASPAAGYTATAADGDNGTVTITSIGYAAGSSRTVEATIEI